MLLLLINEMSIYEILLRLAMSSDFVWHDLSFLLLTYYVLVICIVFIVNESCILILAEQGFVFVQMLK